MGSYNTRKKKAKNNHYHLPHHHLLHWRDPQEENTLSGWPQGRVFHYPFISLSLSPLIAFFISHLGNFFFAKDDVCHHLWTLQINLCSPKAVTTPFVQHINEVPITRLLFILPVLMSSRCGTRPGWVLLSFLSSSSIIITALPLKSYV